MGRCYLCFGCRDKDSQSGDGSGITRFTLDELYSATNKFSNEIGQGSFGHVCWGKLQGSRQSVAVKRLFPWGSEDEKNFPSEAVRVSLLQHPNIVKLIGYCADNYERLLVYEYMPLGSLQSFLHGKLGRVNEKIPVLGWKRRMRIAADVASALNFLHSENVTYRALKSSNVLLGEGYRAKLSDLGFAKPVDDAMVSPAASAVSIKSDVYNFGILLLELISGIRPTDMVQGDGRSVLAEWARLLVSDDHLPKTTDFPKHILKRAAQVALMCVEDEPNSRANMNDVVKAMHQLVDDEQGDQPSKGKTTEGESTKGKGQSSKDKDAEEVEEEVEEVPLVRRRRKRKTNIITMYPLGY